MENIYLDHAATSPVHPEVADVTYDMMKQHFGNASSVHSFGRDSRRILDQSRILFAKSIGAKPNEIIITSGGTESDNTAIMETALSRKKDGMHLITSAVEHHAVLRPMEHLETLGFEVTYLPVDEDGRVNPEDVETALRTDTILVSIMHGNNEVGTLMDIHAIGEIIEESESNAYFHTDAVQAYGSEDIDVKRDHVDLLSVSAHKINGPKGIGFLYVSEDIHLPSFILGGEQEQKRRAGTENIPGIAGFKKAVEIMLAAREERKTHYEHLRAHLMQMLDKNGIEYDLNGPSEHNLPHIINLWLKGVFAEQLLVSLDLAGIAVSAGSACTAGNVDPSHVLSAMYGEDSPRISESIRISFGLGTTEEQLDIVMEVLTKSVQRLKK